MNLKTHNMYFPPLEISRSKQKPFAECCVGGEGVAKSVRVEPDPSEE